MFFWLCVILFWLPIKIFLPTKVIGKKNVPKSGAGILACNHLSNHDVFLLNASFGHGKRWLYYLCKKEWMEKKFFGWVLRKWHAYPVDRGNVDLKAVKFALTTLKEGNLLQVFPEGTRNKISEDEIQSLKAGIILFQAKTDAPIIPMMFIRKPKFLRRNWLVVGEPVYFQFETPGKPTKEEQNKASQELSEIMTKLRTDFLEKRNSKK